MILDESGFIAGMNNAVKKLNSFDETIERKSRNSGSSLGSIWKIFAGSFLASGVTRIVGAGFDLIKGSISGAVDRVDTMNNALRNFQNMGFSNSEIMKNIGKNGLLSQGIQGLPTALNDAISHVQLLASSTGDLTRSTQIFKALNDGILGFGGSTDQVNEAVIQLSQSFSNGKVDAQTWNSMINAQLGPTLSAIAKKMGITMGDLKEGLSQGKISVEEFQNQLIEMDTKGGGGLKSLSQIAKDSTKGIKTSIQNAKTAVTRGVGEVIEGLNKALVDSDLGGFKGIIDKVGSSMESFLKVIAANMPITHVSAVLGLEKMMTGQSKVLSVNGKYGAVVLTKADLGLENAITELPYASENTDGILTAEMFQQIVNGEGGTYLLPIATAEQLGGIKVGELLEITEEGILSAIKQTDFNFTEELKEKLESVKVLKAGANISIAEDGTISSTGGSESGGVNQLYVDQKFQEAVDQAKSYTNERIPNFTFEKIGEV
ncbi:hypothetical protein DSH85_11110 [Enterococcus faecium]|nr:hypothetical protein [Enterococcus faecium]EME7147138.1 tape measure protein [Enterococcus faecium]